MGVPDCDLLQVQLMMWALGFSCLGGWTNHRLGLLSELFSNFRWGRLLRVAICVLSFRCVQSDLFEQSVLVVMVACLFLSLGGEDRGWMWLK